MSTIAMSSVRRWVTLLALAITLSAASGRPASAAPAGAPDQMKIGFVDFLSGPGATFGTSSKDAAEWLVEKWNKEGGIRGVKVRLLIVDEAGGTDKQVTEYRRLVLDDKVDVVVGYTSSADCLAVAAVADELKTLTVAHVCGTRRLIEDRRLRYMFRTVNHQVADSVLGARYVLAMNPDVRTIAGVNEDYAWGRDSWDDFKDAMLRLKPDVKVVAELWTKIQATEHSAEISKLLLAKPDAIHSSFWSGGLISFVKQGAPRGLLRNRLVYFSTGIQALQELKRDIPDGVIVAQRGTAGYFLRPDPEENRLQKDFVEGIRARSGRFPDHVAYLTYQALAGVRAAYEKAIDRGGGRWPTAEAVVKAFEGLTWEVPYGSVTMRADHQAVHGAIVGLTKFSPQFGFPVVDRIIEFRAEDIVPPQGVTARDWLKTLRK